eukprot:1138730-Pelagomonas_calceolata.AAC.6
MSVFCLKHTVSFNEAARSAFGNLHLKFILSRKGKYLGCNMHIFHVRTYITRNNCRWAAIQTKQGTSFMMTQALGTENSRCKFLQFAEWVSGSKFDI